MSVGPNIVGLNIEEVKKIMSNAENIRFLPIGSIITADYRPNRIRVWYDPETNIVKEVTNG